MPVDSLILLPLHEAVTLLRVDWHSENRTTLDPCGTLTGEIADIEADPQRLRIIERNNPRWRETTKTQHPEEYFVPHHANHVVVRGDLDMDRESRDEFFGANGECKCRNGNVDLAKALLAGRDIFADVRMSCGTRQD